MEFLSLLLLLILVGATMSLDGDDPVVCVPQLGCVEGIQMPGFRTDYFEAFLGIPYALPPVGDLRFANPVPSHAWDGILKAQAPKPDCIQKNYLLPDPLVSGKEDCLYLNVYRPVAISDALLPVMVYIYGGGFFAGSANPGLHGPEYFMDTRDVILVTFAYRLGALGFLSTGDNNCPGNFALKDQALALQWVQNYIRDFGGNPERVTIFGQSAGGASVHMHMLSPLSRGLFQRAIVMSGNAAAPYNNVITNPLEQAQKQAEYSGIKNYNQLSTKELVNALRKVDAMALVNSGDKFKYWHVDPLTTFRPVIESDSPGAFLTEDPAETVRVGNYQHVPWMTGFVPFEGAVRALSIISNENLRNEFNSKFDFLLASLMEFTAKSKYQLQDKVNKLVNFYLNGSHELTLANAQGFGDMISDRAFLHPLYKNIKNYVHYANTSENPVYLYKFAYKGAFSYSFVYTGNLNNYGVVHCDELIYLFRSPFLFGEGFNSSSKDAKVSNALIETFVSFAKNGEPKKFAPIKPCNRQSFSRSERIENTMCDYQEFKNNVESSDNFIIEGNNFFDLDVIRFWDDLLN